MQYVHDFTDIHKYALNALANTLEVEEGLSLRDMHFHLEEKLKFRNWLKAGLFNDVWEYTHFVRLEDIIQKNRKIIAGRFQEMQTYLQNVKENLFNKPEDRESAIHHIKVAYLNVLKEVESYRFACRLYEDNPFTPTTWVQGGETRIGQEDYFLSTGDLLRFVKNLAVAFQYNQLYQALEDLYFTISFDFAQAENLKDIASPSWSSEQADLENLGKEIMKYLRKVHRQIN